MWVAITLYKKILFYLMLAGSMTRLTASALLAMMGKINLPVLLVVLSLLVAGLGIFTVAKAFWGKITLTNLVVYHLVAGAATVLSFILLHFYMVDISLIETLITGSVLSLLFSATVLLLTFRKKRYITVRQKKEKQLAERQIQLAAKEN